MPTLRVADATLYYEIRGSGPLVVGANAPMDAAAFAPAADLLAVDHNKDSTPQDRADDLAALLTHLDAGPAAVLGSSGGAVTALALAQAHPGLVHTVVAHEPRSRSCSTTATSCARMPSRWSSGTARATRSGRGSCSSTRPTSRCPPS